MSNNIEVATFYSRYSYKQGQSSEDEKFEDYAQQQVKFSLVYIFIYENNRNNILSRFIVY